MINSERIKRLNNGEFNSEGKFVLYWMQAAQRAEWNHALEVAAKKANDFEKPLVCLVCLTGNYPGAQARHYAFMLQGLQETGKSLSKRNIPFVIKTGDPPEEVIKFAKDAALVVTDAFYTREPRKWREEIAKKLNIPFIQVETNIVVPVETASDKEEYAARTIRPKINKRRDEFLLPVPETKLKNKISGKDLKSYDMDDIDKVISHLKIKTDAAPVDTFKGGASEARKLLDKFISDNLDKYDDKSNDPAEDVLSQMSPYLHFGQISPVEIALRINETDSPGREAYLEQLIVRRELAINFCWYNPDYDSYKSSPDWAKETLEKHKNDKKETVYKRKQFENAETHDEYWNAAQKEMVITGKMHGYMRMYWAKKTLEWSKSPEEAFKTAVYLNDKYELDGRDPNGYTGVAWCFGKHDHPWQERPIFGKVRSMMASGLKRKFDIEEYVERVKDLEK